MASDKPSLVKPHVMQDEVREDYRQIADDTERKAEAMEWVEGVAWDVDDRDLPAHHALFAARP